MAYHEGDERVRKVRTGRRPPGKATVLSELRLAFDTPPELSGEERERRLQVMADRAAKGVSIWNGSPLSPEDFRQWEREQNDTRCGLSCVQIESENSEESYLTSLANVVQ